MFVAIQMFDDELREFWNWPKHDLQIKLSKPYAQDYGTEIIGGSRHVMLLGDQTFWHTLMKIMGWKHPLL